MCCGWIEFNTAELHRVFRGRGVPNGYGDQMPRAQASATDAQLVVQAAGVGLTISTRQIERWREQGLIPRNIRRGQGRGRGSRSDAPPGTAELVMCLAQHARRGRRPRDLALLAFGAGLAVPELTIRRALAGVVENVSSLMDKHSAHVVEPAMVLIGRSLVSVVPQRIRRIDRAICVTVDLADPLLTAQDVGYQTSGGLTLSAFGDVARLVVQDGLDAIDVGTIAAMSRSLLPAGAAPLAGLLEFNVPAAATSDGAALLSDEGGLVFLPAGNFPRYLRNLAERTPLGELVDMWQLAGQLSRWATDLCDRVERELESGELGDAALEWMWTSIGAARPWLAMAIRDKNRPADIACSTLMLIFVRDMLRWLRQHIPNGRFDFLLHPVGLPRVLAPLVVG